MKVKELIEKGYIGKTDEKSLADALPDKIKGEELTLTKEAEVIQEFEASATSPLELVMDYMQKRMDQIDETRRSFKAQYPDLLPAILIKR